MLHQKVVRTSVYAEWVVWSCEWMDYEEERTYGNKKRQKGANPSTKKSMNIYLSEMAGSRDNTARPESNASLPASFSLSLYINL